MSQNDIAVEYFWAQHGQRRMINFITMFTFII